MKKYFTLCFLLLFIMGVNSQTVPRQMVMVEAGNWLNFYDPGSAMGCDDLLQNGCQVAVVFDHYSDGFNNQYSAARLNLFGITGFPSDVFDGKKGYCAGNHTTSLYYYYKPIYDSSIIVGSPVTMSMNVAKADSHYTVTVTITKITTSVIPGDLRMFFFLTKSHIQHDWYTLNHVEHVNSRMIPNENGTVVDFSDSGTRTITLNFIWDQLESENQYEFVAILQNVYSLQGYIPGHGCTGTDHLKKLEVLQCIKRGVIDLTPEFSSDFTQVPVGGTISFINQTFGGYLGDTTDGKSGVPESFKWLFPGGVPSSDTVRNPVVTYNEFGLYDVSLIVNRGGQIDTLTKTGYVAAGNVWVPYQGKVLSLSVFPNPNPGIFTLEIKSDQNMNANLRIVNETGTEIYSEKQFPVTNGMKKTIHLEKAVPGFYTLLLEANGKTIPKKLVIRPNQ
jgi:hypothetical protein